MQFEQAGDIKEELFFKFPFQKQPVPNYTGQCRMNQQMRHGLSILGLCTDGSTIVTGKYFNNRKAFWNSCTTT